MARKTNVTGIKGLSIGTTKNAKGFVSHRYIVNHKVGDKIVSKSFYFGVRVSQKEAYKKAIAYMAENGLTTINSKQADDIYINYRHIMLV